MKIGITIASFHSLGAVFSDRDLLKINWRGLERVVFRDSSSFPDIWSGSGAVLSFSSDILHVFNVREYDVIKRSETLALVWGTGTFD